MGLLIITVGSCVVLNRVEFQKTPILGTNFLDDSNEINLETLNAWMNASEKDYYDVSSQEYIRCLIAA